MRGAVVVEVAEHLVLLHRGRVARVGAAEDADGVAIALEARARHRQLVERHRDGHARREEREAPEVRQVVPRGVPGDAEHVVGAEQVVVHRVGRRVGAHRVEAGGQRRRDQGGVDGEPRRLRAREQQLPHALGVRAALAGVEVRGVNRADAELVAVERLGHRVAVGRHPVVAVLQAQGVERRRAEGALIEQQRHHPAQGDGRAAGAQLGHLGLDRRQRLLPERDEVDGPRGVGVPRIELADEEAIFTAVGRGGDGELRARHVLVGEAADHADRPGNAGAGEAVAQRAARGGIPRGPERVRLISVDLHLVDAAALDGEHHRVGHGRARGRRGEAHEGQTGVQPRIDGARIGPARVAGGGGARVLDDLARITSCAGKGRGRPASEQGGEHQQRQEVLHSTQSYSISIPLRWAVPQTDAAVSSALWLIAPRASPRRPPARRSRAACARP